MRLAFKSAEDSPLTGGAKARPVLAFQSAWRRVAGLSLGLLLAFSARAVETRVWNQSDQLDFARGTEKNLSIRSDGHIRLAPAMRELDSTSVPYLWAVAEDSKGTVYYSGGAPTGSTTKVFALASGGKPRVLAEIPGLEVHALAIDGQDRVYAAVLPDAKIYRIDSAGKAQLFFDPKCKYVWAMSFDKNGNLFVATGDAGLIFKVGPDGKGSKFYDSEETHARSMLIEDDGSLIVGTEPGGLVMRISPQGKSFVLYQTSKREVTAVAERGGVIYAASVGNKTLPVLVSGAAPVLPSNPPATTAAGTPRTGATPPSLPPPVGSLSAAVVGGSEVVRIDKDGFAERVWSSPTDLAYALAFDGAGRPLIGTGNRGLIYRLDSVQISTQLINIAPTQVTAFHQGRNNTLYAVTGNVGSLFAIAPELAKEGMLTSEVLDGREFTYWGKVHCLYQGAAGTVRLETRSGNLSNPETNWSDWTRVELPREGGQIASPPARFLQSRLRLEGGGGPESLEVSSIDIAYEAKNIAPHVNQIEVAPFNYRQPATNAALERSLQPSGSPTTLTLPAVGTRRSGAGSGASSEGGGSATLQYSKGFVTLRWTASDSNGDPLVFKVEIRPKSGGPWRMLGEKIADRFYAFDSAAFPDGQYVARISASDIEGNVPSEALSGWLESDPFTIDNTPPELMDVKVGRASGQTREVSFTAKDAWSWIDRATYSVDGHDWTLLNPLNRVTDSQTLSYRISAEAGQTLAIRVFDEDDNVSVKQLQVQ